MLKPRSFYDQKAAELLNAPPEFERFNGVFSGPSIDLHLWALEQRPQAFSRDDATRRFLRAVYSVLVAWGMHRMGNGGASMPRFAEFEESILCCNKTYENLWAATVDNCAWDALKEAFCKMRATTSRSPIVANSKALFHLLPNIVVPIDREYTMRFLKLHYWYQNHRGDSCSSWSLFRELHEHFFHPILQSQEFRNMQMWDHEMCSKPTKFLDNLVVAKVRSRRRPGGRRA